MRGIQTSAGNKAFGAAVFAFLLTLAVLANVHVASAYTPKAGDYLKYSETTTVKNGTGSYSGYTDQAQTTGTEQMNSVSGSIVSSSYDYSYQYSNSQASSTAASSAGGFTWSLSNYTYVNNTDNEQGFGGFAYSKPLYVWFAMNSSLPVGGTFSILNSQFTVLSKNYTLLVPTENEYVKTIQAESTGQYQRDDAYGTFTATYTWVEYFDPATGYIVGYTYLEQDNGQYDGGAGSFTYTDSLYVTSTSYPLAAASAPTSTTTTSTSQMTTTGGTSSYLPYVVAGVVILLIVGIAIYAATRRRGKKTIPEHSPPPYSPPPSPPAAPVPSGIDLGSKPPEQVVIKEIPKVKCKFCGTLIPITSETCPYCGAPQG